MKHDQYAALAWAIFLCTGPASNVRAVSHCMTRLRLHLATQAPDLAAQLQHIAGVLGTNQSGDELQIILGPGRAAEVAACYAAYAGQTVTTAAEPSPCTNTTSPEQAKNSTETSGTAARPAFGDGKALHNAIRARNATPVKLFFRRIASIFIPLIPGFIACGLISGLLNLAGKLAPLLVGTGIYQLLVVAGGCVFWGMNLFIGWNAAKEFGGTPIIGGALGALLTHPALSGVVLNGMPLTPGRGGVMSVLLVAGLAAWLEKRLRRIIPEIFSLFLVPLCTLLLAGTAAILVLQPLGGLVSDLIGQGATAAIGRGGAITGFILGGTFLPMVMLGIHQTLTPIHAELLNQYGVTILLPVLAMAGAGQVGASFAVWWRTHNARLKKTVASALPVGILGVGEPLIYGVTLPLGRPFIGACIGGACGGAVQAAFMVGAATLGISGLPLAAATDNIAIYLLGLVTAYAGGFIATCLLGFDDPED